MELTVKIFFNVVLLIFFLQMFKSGYKANAQPDFSPEYSKSEGYDLPPSPDFDSEFGGNDYHGDYNPMDEFRVGSGYCEEKALCSSWPYLTFPNKNCHCDKLCGILEDCCSNYKGNSSEYITKDQFSCLPLQEIVKNPQYGVELVTKCGQSWKDEVTKSLCENVKSDDILLHLPVSDESVQTVMYKNMHCAHCNNVYNYKFWQSEVKCRDDLGVRALPSQRDCDWFFIPPTPKLSFRTCQLQPVIISVCPIYAIIDESESVKMCDNMPFSLVTSPTGKVFKNKYCAECNGISENDMYCEQMPEATEGSTQLPVPKKDYSFRLLVDYNSKEITGNTAEMKIPSCAENEIFDPFSWNCRMVYCPPSRKFSRGVCVPEDSFPISIQTNKSLNYSKENNCTMIKLHPSEYNLINISHLFIVSQQKVYTNENFLTNGSDVFICRGKFYECEDDCDRAGARMFQFDESESYVSLVCLIVSVTSLAITLLVYISFPQLLNTPGKLLVCLILCLLLGQVLFIVSSKVEKIIWLCKSVAVVEQFSFLGAFCWMNMIALDLWMTFSKSFVTPGTSNKGRKRFMWYSLYAWLTPLMIVTVAVVLNFIEIDADFEYLKPMYGKHACWISSRYSLILFFAGPLAVCKIFDIVAFVFTAVHIARAKRDSAMARKKKKNTCSFLINVKLSLILGLSWVFAFIANATNETYLWYLFVIFNGLQGLFIALSFLLTKRVVRLMRDKYKLASSSGTQSTSMS